MARYGRTRWTRAAACAAALVVPLAVSSCKGSDAPAHFGGIGQPEASSGAPSAPASSASDTSSGTPAPSTSSSAPDATAGTGLTISDGTSKVWMDGKVVDFGTPVHDLAWSPDGKQAAFLDGGGNLVVSNPDGSGKVEVAKNPGGQKWSHPTWQVTPVDPMNNVPVKDNIFFAANVGGVTNLEVVVATAHDGKPAKLRLVGYAGETGGPPPQTGNGWPSASGKFGGAVYEHDQGSATDVYVRDDYLRQQGGLSVKNAAQPDFVLIGTGDNTDPEMVFVRTVNGHKHVFKSGVLTSTGGDKTTETDLTANTAVDCTAPVLSPDGKTVAYSTATGVETVNADGSGKPTQVTSAPGFPSYRPS